MGLDSVTTLTAVCDRCGFKEEVNKEPSDEYYQGDWQYWRGRFSMDVFLLCSGCVSLMRRFLQGGRIVGLNQ